MADAHKNFAYSTVRGTNEGDTTNPGTGTTLTVQKGHGSKFPPVPFNATVWGTGTQPTLTGVAGTTAEIVRVTNIQDDTFTIIRADGETGEPNNTSTNRSIVVGDQIAAAITAKTLVDAEDGLNYYAPLHIAGSGQTGFQTLGGTGLVGTNSLFVFPVTVPPNLQFNQILIGNSLSYITLTSNTSGSNTYYSYYGLYSMNANTALSLISSSSFSIKESVSSRSITWSFPQTTNTTGWGYQTSSFSSTNNISSYISGSRIIGMQFGGNFTLTGGQYYLGILRLRSTANTVSTNGLSHAGLVGQPVHPVNMVSGTLMGIGSAASDWQANNANQTAWWGRHIIGFLTNTGRAGFGGNAIPQAITLSELGTTGGAGSTATILPSVTFVST